MIELTKGDILEADVEALVNTVNCVGIMGRGIALQFRKAFPSNYRFYQAACDRGKVRPGRMLLFETRQLAGPRYIINFPTKRHWKGKSRLEYIRSGLKDLVTVIRERNIKSIAVPPLGSGLGGLEWPEVKRVIFAAFSEIPSVRVLLYEPVGAPPPRKMVKTSKVPNMTAGRAVLLELMRKYLSAVMDPSVTLLELHKLMYFMQEAGERLNLKFVKGTYGPYATNLRHVLSTIEGHFITGYGDADDAPGRPIELLPGATERAQSVLETHEETRQRSQRVATLIKGFETPFGMEILATVHWVASRERANSLQEAVSRAFAWNDRKKAFGVRSIEIAWEALRKLGWVPVTR